MNIYSLTTDIQHLISKQGWLTEEIAEGFASQTKARLLNHYNGEQKPTLRLSQMGPKCPCALWHSIHKPEMATPLPPWAKFKYSFGHIIEAQAITLAKASGHQVTGEQDALWVDGVKGHRDCVIDGCVVDVKSTSSRGFQDFKAGNHSKLDTWGYLSQLDGYVLGSLSDPLVVVKDRGFLLAIDLQLGHMHLYEHRIRETHIRDRIREYKRVVDLEVPPRCTCETQPEGLSGNIKLGTKASYSQFKFACFPSLRTFIYASGPVYLTKVVRVPDVPEVDKLGNRVYN